MHNEGYIPYVFISLAGCICLLIVLARFRALILKKYKLPMWFALSVLLFVLMGFNLPFLFTLTVRAESGDAVIEGVMPNQHCSTHYRYQVHGKEFTGLDSGKCNVAVGSHQQVYYDPLHPDRSILTAPKAALINDLIPALLAALLFPMLILYGVGRFQKSASA
jgi:hypothetical protein